MCGQYRIDIYKCAYCIISFPSLKKKDKHYIKMGTLSSLNTAPWSLRQWNSKTIPLFKLEGRLDQNLSILFKVELFLIWKNIYILRMKVLPTQMIIFIYYNFFWSGRKMSNDFNKQPVFLITFSFSGTGVGWGLFSKFISLIQKGNLHSDTHHTIRPLISLFFMTTQLFLETNALSFWESLLTWFLSTDNKECCDQKLFTGEFK